MDEVSLTGIFFGLLSAMVGLYFLLVGFRSQKPTPAPTLPTIDVARSTGDAAGLPPKSVNSEVESDIAEVVAK